MKACIIGGGVIGGGWAARFLLNGWDVVVFDPDPQAERKIGEVLANAKAALPRLYDRALPKAGSLSFSNNLAEAVNGASWIQESVPERLDLKHHVFAEIGALPDDVILGSSTSGFKPSELNSKGAQAIVAHPFNPVYLLPLVELVGDQGKTKAAAEILKSMGMYPLTLRKEIDAHIADRLLEAVWREGLWLIHDDVATTEEIDEAIRMGFGLRWAQMGLFETYRIAGGEAGMKHFIGQFGPALAWPWTKLMDVPELTPELTEKIAAQSDAQSGQYSIRELERQRDDNLIGFIRHLKAQSWGAGEVIANHEANFPAPQSEILEDKIITMRGQILPSWIDYNGHLTEHRYAQLFADGGDQFLILAGLDTQNLSQGGSYFTAQTHINFKDEMKLGEGYHIEARLLSHDEKRIHLYQSLYAEDGRLTATAEHLLLFVDTQTRKTAKAPEEILKNLANFAKLSKGQSFPTDAGKTS